jgi:hypothetical protein
MGESWRGCLLIPAQPKAIDAPAAIYDIGAGLLDLLA